MFLEEVDRVEHALDGTASAGKGEYALFEEW
jgi:hypothetical protein